MEQIKRNLYKFIPIIIPTIHVIFKPTYHSDLLLFDRDSAIDIQNVSQPSVDFLQIRQNTSIDSQQVCGKHQKFLCPFL